MFKFLILCLLISLAANAEVEDGSCGDARKTETTTAHTIKIKNKTISYTATTGFVEVAADDAKSKACVFYTSYVVTSKNAAAPRPITFAFNGGPGSASLWLHMGFLGPRRVDMGQDGMNPPKTPRLLDNEFSPLDTTDIVMIDPVSTGFSHTVGDTKEDKFFGVKNDYKSIATFIQNYINLNNRWLSPKFILGESYGGIRGTLLARHLQADFSIGIAGVILVSPALSWTSLDFEAPDNNVPYRTYFANFATTAWFQKRSTAANQALSVDEVYQKAKSFADTQLRDTLDLGNTATPAQYESTLQTMSDFTGISKLRLNELNLRVDDGVFFGELLRDRNQVVGRYDGRFVGQKTSHSPGKAGWLDPSDTATSYPFTAAINQYLRVELGFNSPSPYQVSADADNWPYDSDGESFNVLGDLSTALAENPQLKVMIASGYFDLACPMATVEFELSQLAGGPSIRSRITQTKYFGGHMMYINPDAAALLKADVAAFIHSQTRAWLSSPHASFDVKPVAGELR